MTTPTPPGAAPGHPSGPSPAVPVSAGDHPEHTQHDGHGHGSAATEPEVIGFGKVIAVGVLSVVLFVIGSIWALQIRTATEKAMNPILVDAQGKVLPDAHGNPQGGSRYTAVPAGYGAEEQGIVDQIPFELNTWVEKDHAEAAAKLKGYAWVNQEAGTIRLPIERAMELVVAESAK